MTGLQKELTKNSTGRRMKNNAERTYTSIGELLGVSYMGAKRKVDNNYFTVSEALSILNLLFHEYSNDIEYFKYLFTEQGE